MTWDKTSLFWRNPGGTPTFCHCPALLPHSHILKPITCDSPTRCPWTFPLFPVTPLPHPITNLSSALLLPGPLRPLSGLSPFPHIGSDHPSSFAGSWFFAWSFVPLIEFLLPGHATYLLRRLSYVLYVTFDWLPAFENNYFSNITPRELLLTGYFLPIRPFSVTRSPHAWVHWVAAVSG